MTDLTGRRVLVVGGSKGIGRVIGRRLDREGARVAFAARSQELLDAVVAECSDAAVAVQCDVREPDSCRAVVNRTVEVLGGLDAFVYSAGTYPFVRLAEADASDWSMVLETNLVGAALITAAAIPHLSESRGHAIYLSSNSAGHVPPWKGIGLYITSKTALEKLVRCWEVEHPEVSFTSHVVGPTGNDPDAPAAEMPDPDVLERMSEFTADWYEKGYIPADLTPVDAHADAVVAVLTSDARISGITVTPR